MIMCMCASAGRCRCAHESMPTNNDKMLRIVLATCCGGFIIVVSIQLCAYLQHPALAHMHILKRAHMHFVMSVCIQSLQSKPSVKTCDC
jgi:hypothetical protein